MNSYDEIVKQLTSSGRFRISLGLERIEKILEIIGNPQDKLDCIHVAGTNGKGSVCSIIASILKESGKKTGLYTSPHIFKYNERIQINGNPICDEDFVRYISEIIKISQENNIDLTEFEILTAAMFKYFYDENVDIVVLETGLGGRYDATNVIKKNICSIITHLDLDHTERLGDTKDKIAYEKAGIMKKNCPCIIYEGYEVYRDYAEENDVPLIMITPNYQNTKLSLKGVFQQENLSLAQSCIETFFPEITKETIENGLEKVKHPCRFQYIKEKNMIIDGAHNPNGIEALKQSLDYYYPNTKKRFIFGCLKNKDYKKMIKTLFEKEDEVYFYKFDHKDSCSYEELKKEFPDAKKFDLSVDLNTEKLNIICGSFYMLSDLLKKLNIDPLNT